jgi:voltage-gated hydrogen channel 1
MDAVVIIAGFVVDVALRGPVEEAASLIVVLRLWRVFKIVEELSLGAQEQVEDLEHHIRELEMEISELKRRTPND